MNIDDAVKVLAKHKYEGSGNWVVANRDGVDYAEQDGGAYHLPAFAAIAVAEKLERDAKPEPLPAADWFARLTEAIDDGKANAALVASNKLRALGWEVRSVFPPRDQGEAIPLEFTYRNYKGVVEPRRVIPLGVRFGSTEWHPEPQWFLAALDLDRKALRDFAMRDIVSGRNEPQPTTETDS